MKNNKNMTSEQIRTVKATGKKLYFSPSSGLLFDDRFNELGKARIGRTSNATSVFV